MHEKQEERSSKEKSQEADLHHVHMQSTDQTVDYAPSYDPPWESLRTKELPKATKIECQKKTPNKPAQYAKEFHGSISREEAKDLVSQYADGGYLVRESQRTPGSYTLTLRCGGVSRNYKLYFSEGMHFIVSSVNPIFIVEL
ncbi:N-chimaerin-like [Oculina patagonica]